MNTKLSKKLFEAQKKRFFLYLQKHTATASMVCEALDLYQKNTCRFKREFEQAGTLAEVSIGICQITGFQAAYLSTNPKYLTKRNRLKVAFRNRKNNG